MKSLRRVMIAFLISAASLSFAGDIQIFCEPGLSIYLDDNFMGTSNKKQDGLFLMDVRKGTHTIRVDKDGFVPQSLQVEVSDFPIEVRVGQLEPEPAARVESEATPTPVKKPVGNVIVTSAPQNCTVEIDGQTRIKETPQLSIDGLEAGEHTISFTKAGYESISGVVTILAGGEVRVRGNLLDGEVETVNEGRGSLKIYSKPKRCTVHFRDERREKTTLTLNLTQVPAGEYPIMVEIPGRRLTTTVVIRDETRTELEVSFMKGDEPFSVSYVPH
jgi:hypothetical protein